MRKQKKKRRKAVKCPPSPAIKLSTSPTDRSIPRVAALLFAMVANDLGPAVVAVAWTFAALATLVVGTRIYVRLRILKTLRIDDYVILLTLVSLPPLIVASACILRVLARSQFRTQWLIANCLVARVWEQHLPHDFREMGLGPTPLSPSG